MGMGYSSNMVDTVEEGTVQEYCPKEFDAFMEHMEESDFSMREFASVAQFNDFALYKSKADKELIKKYENLCNAFEKKTGLSLSLGFHSKDDGDCYDDISDVYWSVDGVWQKTPAGEKMGEKVQRQFFVTLG